MNGESCDKIRELTQSILAILVILGGGIAALSGSVHTTEIIPFVALIFGYYFGRQQGISQTRAKNAEESSA